MSDHIQESSSECWYAVQTRHRHEKRVAERLGLIHAQAFLPLHRSIHRWKNGMTVPVDLPLFPSYLFVRIHSSQRVRVLQEPGVLSLAASSKAPTPICDADMHQLIVATQSLRAEPHPYLAVGQRVRIVAGPLAGSKGILIRRKHEFRLVISIEIIMRSITVEVSEFDIEPMSQHSLQATA